MNKLRLLKKMHDEGSFDCLTKEELHLFLLMIAGCNENGEGEILAGQIKWVFGKDFSPDRLNDICGKLEEKHLILLISRRMHGTKRRSLIVAYRIMLPEHSEVTDSKSNST